MENQQNQTEEIEEEDEEEDKEEDGELSKLLFGVVNSPIYTKEKDGKSGIKTPQKDVIRRFFKGDKWGHKKARIVKVQKQIGWPEDLPYKIMRTFVINAGRSKNKRRVKPAIKFSPKMVRDEVETYEDDEWEYSLVML